MSYDIFTSYFEVEIQILVRNCTVLFGWLKTLFSSIFKVFGTQNTSLNPRVSTSQTRVDHDLVAQDTGLIIPFYPSLIDHLESDHQHLLELYTDILTLLDDKKYSEITTQLTVFKADFKAHLDAENIKFYGYLEQRLKDQTEQFAELRRFRKEMRSIECLFCNIRYVKMWKF